MASAIVCYCLAYELEYANQMESNVLVRFMQWKFIKCTTSIRITTSLKIIKTVIIYIIY